MRRLAAVLIALVASAACDTPPEKEYHQAVGAIEAARAAGAATFAPEELAAADAALIRYDAAVGQRDYRQALSHALDARERATAAAAKAGTQKSLVRGETERLITGIATTIERGRTTAASATRAQAQAARALRSTLETAERALQEARAALERDDVVAARRALDGVEDQLTQALAPFQTTAPAAPPRRR